MHRPKLLLSFDVEEFDLPLEYGRAIPTDQQLETGKAGLDALTVLLRSYPVVRSTCFTTGFFAETFPEAIRNLSERHEIASHTYFHSEFSVGDLKRSKQALEAVTGKQVTGLRMPRMRPVAMGDVAAAGYVYDSSINPCRIPGRYDNRHLSRTPYREEGMLRFPASVTPRLRVPLFWLSFKNAPYAIYRRWLIKTLKQDGYACLYFHPWEFVPLESYGLPLYVRRHSGEALQRRLKKLIEDFGPSCDFLPMKEYISQSVHI